MTKKISAQPKTGRKRYSPEFKQQALLRAMKDGVSIAARELGLEPAQLYAWRTQIQRQGQDAEAQRGGVSPRDGPSNPARQLPQPITVIDHVPFFVPFSFFGYILWVKFCLAETKYGLEQADFWRRPCAKWLGAACGYMQWSRAACLCG